MNRLQALVDMAIADDLGEGAQLLRFILALHRHVRTIPIAHHAKPFELRTLHVYLLQRVLATRLTKRARLERLHFLAARLLDLMFDGQTMTIPARHIRRIVAVERARFDDNVLQRLVDCMTQVDRAVCVRRTIRKNKRRSPARDCAQLRVDLTLFPPLQHLGLATREIRLHGEVGLRQIDGLLVIHGLVIGGQRTADSTGKERS